MSPNRANSLSRPTWGKEEPQRRGLSLRRVIFNPLKVQKPSLREGLCVTFLRTRKDMKNSDFSTKIPHP